MKKFLISILLGALFISSCKKDENENPQIKDPDGVTLETNSIQQEFDDLLRISGEAISRKDGNMNVRTTFLCSTIAIDYDAKRITVDFGSGCVGNDGKYRKGIIYVDYTDRYRDSASVITISTSDYFVNGVKVISRSRMINKGHNPAGNLFFEITDTDVTGSGYARIVYPNGQATTWKSVRMREWEEGDETLEDISDDVYITNGTSEGVVRNSITYQMLASEVTVKFSCWQLPVNGTLEIGAGDQTRMINYGTGKCDRIVTYTDPDGNVSEVEL